jgi:hypothetical protein
LCRQSLTGKTEFRHRYFRVMVCSVNKYRVGVDPVYYPLFSLPSTANVLIVGLRLTRSNRHPDEYCESAHCHCGTSCSGTDILFRTEYSVPVHKALGVNNSVLIWLAPQYRMYIAVLVRGTQRRQHVDTYQIGISRPLMWYWPVTPGRELLPRQFHNLP